jgi:hypothetical protein
VPKHRVLNLRRRHHGATHKQPPETPQRQIDQKEKHVASYGTATPDVPTRTPTTKIHISDPFTLNSPLNG